MKNYLIDVDFVIYRLQIFDFGGRHNRKVFLRKR